VHAHVQELLSMRDGEPVAAEVERHVAECVHCGLEFARLQRLRQELLQLPQFEPAKHLWHGIREQLDRRSNRSVRSSWVFRSAAALVVIILAPWVVWTTAHLGYGRFASGGSTAAVSGSEAVDKDPIGPLVTRSQRLEAILQNMPRRPTVQRAATSATIDELQTRIELLDLQLANLSKGGLDSEQSRRLWSTRIQLLDSLLYVRYAEAARDGLEASNSLDSGVI
jgi:hypothetical protein